MNLCKKYFVIKVFKNVDYILTYKYTIIFMQMHKCDQPEHGQTLVTSLFYVAPYFSLFFSTNGP